MGIINTSPESFHKKSVQLSKTSIRNTVKQMESDGADIIDVGGMSTAPYLKTIVSEKIELKRVVNAIKIIQNSTNLPISIDTCRSSVAKDVLEFGVDVINDISGLKYDKEMSSTVSKFNSGIILCAFDQKTVSGNVNSTKKLLSESLKIAKKSGVSENKIILDPAIGFFRKSGNGPFFTKIKSNWVTRDLEILNNLKSLSQKFPILISVSNKSFLGEILGETSSSDRIYGSIAAETISVLNGAKIIRSHNVKATKDAILVASKLKNKRKGL